jgi:hypothetical protein
MLHLPQHIREGSTRDQFARVYNAMETDNADVVDWTDFVAYLTHGGVETEVSPDDGGVHCGDIDELTRVRTSSVDGGGSGIGAAAGGGRGGSGDGGGGGRDAVGGAGPTPTVSTAPRASASWRNSFGDEKNKSFASSGLSSSADVTEP